MMEAAKSLILAWQMVAKRSLAHWRLLLSVVLGVLLASAILSGTIIYFDSLRDLSLENGLQQHSPTELDVVIQTKKSPISSAEYATVRAIVDRETRVGVGWMLTDRLRVGSSPTFFLARPGEEERAGRDDARTFFAFVPRLEERISLAPGGWSPTDRPSTSPGEPPEVEALVSLEAARMFGVQAGDRLVAVPPSDEAVPYVNVVISGVFERKRPADAEFWYLDQEVVQARTGGTFRTIPFYIHERAFMEVLGPSFRRMEGTYAWLLDLDVDRVNAGNAEPTLAGMRAMNGVLATTLPTYRHTTAIETVLAEYERRIFFTRVPMFVVLVLIAIVILYYVATLSSLAVENRRSEVAVLRSRGASTSQILTVFVLEGATIALLVILVAPLLAAAAITLLGLTPAFSDLTGGDLLRVTISGGSYSMSAIGGLLSFVALLIPAVQASRFGVTQQRQQAARPSRVPAFQRYYLDLMLLIVGIYLFQQLTEQGSLVATDLLGGAAVDQLLLAVPGVILVALAMVLLRLFPPAMGLLSRLVSPGLPAGLAVGVWQIARDPIHYARLSLLLMLAAGLGMFASNFGSTLERSFKERVLYEVGTDVRVSNVQPDPNAAPSSEPLASLDGDSRPPLVQAYEGVRGVRRASRVLRSPGQDLTSLSSPSFEILAVDAQTFDQVAWFREDFADEPMDRLLRSLVVPDLPIGVQLPAGVRSITVRLRADRLQPTVVVSARLRNAEDQHFNLTLGTLSSTDWLVLETDPSAAGQARFLASGPIALVSLQLNETSAGRILEAGSILFDEISVTTDSGGTTVVERFDDAEGWDVLRTTPRAVSDDVRPSAEAFEGESGSVVFVWAPGDPLTARGIFSGPERSPLPVLASRSFVKATGHSRGDTFDVSVGGIRLPVELVSVVEMFPTMTDPEKSFLVSDLTSLTRYANLGAVERALPPIQLWLSTVDDVPRTGILERLANVVGYKSSGIVDRSKRLEVSRVDPLVEAGWRALLFIAFSAVLILSGLGFLVHAYVSFRSREVQFALMRTVGFSMRQLTAMVWLEQALVIALGMGLGTWMGGRLGATIMPFLGHDDQGARVVPPFAIQVNWGALLLTYLAMLLVFLIISVALIWFIRRITLQRLLRLGEV